MKKIIVPAPISARDAETGVTNDLFLGQYVTLLVEQLVVDQFNCSGPAIRAGIRVMAAFKEKDVEGASVVLDDADHKVLLDAMENPRRNGQPEFPIKPGRMAIPLLDAVKDAKEPRPKAAE